MMDRFVTKRPRTTTGPSVSSTLTPQIPSSSSIPAGPQPEVPSSSSIPAPSTQAPPAVGNEFKRWKLQTDPALRKPISSYHPNDQDSVRRSYLQMGPMKRDIVYPLVYLLITLSLILPVVTATVERVFSAMKIVKNHLRSRIGDE